MTTNLSLLVVGIRVRRAGTAATAASLPPTPGRASGISAGALCLCLSARSCTDDDLCFCLVETCSNCFSYRLGLGVGAGRSIRIDRLCGRYCDFLDRILWAGTKKRIYEKQGRISKQILLCSISRQNLHLRLEQFLSRLWCQRKRPPSQPSKASHWRTYLEGQILIKPDGMRNFDKLKRTWSEARSPRSAAFIMI